jgi:hypothetical protein
VNRVAPGRLVTDTSPWCASTTARTIASPRPVLPARREREESPRANSLEERAEQAGRDAGTVVLDREHHVVAVALEHGDHARTVGRVHARVGEQVGDDLAQPGLVARHDGRGIREPDLPIVAGARRLRVADRLDHDAIEVDRSGSELAALVEPSEQQQVLDELGHAHRLRLDAADACTRRAAARRRAAGELGVAADRRERRPQLVARVGDEAAHLLLALLARRRARGRRARACG